MPDNNEYRFLGETYYGYCNTSATSQTKSTFINGWDNSCFYDGMRITIYFKYAQTYNGNPMLSISNTGGIYIYRNGDTKASQYEWPAKSYVSLVYSTDVGGWIIDNGNQATTTYWGKTKLSNTIANDSTTALTPKAVYDAGYLTLADLPIYDGSVT